MTLTADLPKACTEIAVQLLPSPEMTLPASTEGLEGDRLIQAQRRKFESMNAEPLTLHHESSPPADWRRLVELPKGREGEEVVLRVVALGRQRIWLAVRRLPASPEKSDSR